MKEEELKKLTIKGIGWSFSEKIIGYLLQFLFTILLARILVPEDFGLVGILVVFISVSQVFVESGFTQALIQKKHATKVEYDSVFWFNIIIGLFIYILLFFGSSFISDFYDEPRLELISQVCFISIVVNSFSVVPNALVQKMMDFKILAKRTIIANIISGLLSVVLAYYGFGVWALVFQTLFANILKGILLWYSVTWKPSFVLSLAAIKNLMTFSFNIMLSSLFDTIVSNFHLLIIGKYYSKVSLGFYTQAYNLQSIPANALVSVVRSVSFPAMAKIQEDIEALQKYFMKMQSLSFLVVFNLFVFLSIIGDDLILFLLGDKWMNSVEYFKLVCFIGAFLPLYNLGMNILLVKNKSKKYLLINIAKRLVTICCVVFSISFGIKQLIYGQIVAVIVNSLVTMMACSGVIQLSLLKQLKYLYKSFFIGITTYGILFFIKQYYMINNHLLSLVVYTTFFILLLVTLMFVINHDGKNYIKNSFKKIYNGIN